jgi:HAD superfamily hydrolase (TIGR01484 family)
VISLSSLPAGSFSKIKGVCFDIDDTFSSHGKILPEAFQSLWDLKRAGYYLIPVTGRPAGWCDMIARFWPIDGVVGENGAFTFYMHQKIRQRLETLNEADSLAARSKLASLRTAIKTEFPHAEFASDQDYREYDLAVDFCEDVPAWPESEVDRLVSFCQAQGAIAKVSSIHVNTWFGQYTKIEGIRKFATFAQKNMDPKFPNLNEFIYIGDSPNDEPMFEAFAESVGVANVRQFLPKMKHPPKYITPSEAGLGFAELAKFLQT